MKVVCLLLVSLLPLSALHGQESTADPLSELGEWLTKKPAERPVLGDAVFAGRPLTREQAGTARDLLWKDRQQRLERERAQEWKNKSVSVDGTAMKFDYRIFGERPKSGRALFISMHGGGGAPARVNDQQWRNQIGLYKPAEGVYLAPRAPGNTWNLWHVGAIDGLFDRIIEDAVLFEGVDRNRVYLMGYSAGGDGVYQLAPRMADRFAAAAMMAGHPNETDPAGLRNLPFTLHMGARDGAYQRNQVAASWKTKLADLRKADPGGYEHEVIIHPGMGHWMKLKDKVAVPWMARHTRVTRPDRIVWRQDDVQHGRSYWLAMPESERGGRARAVVSRDGQTFTIDPSTTAKKLQILLDDRMSDLDREVVVRLGDQVLCRAVIKRTIAVIHRTLEERGDPDLIFCAELAVDFQK